MFGRNRKTLFERIADTVLRRYKSIVIIWVITFLGAFYLNSVYPVSDILSFSQEGSLPKDTESYVAQRIADEQFPGRAAASGITIVVVADNVTSPLSRDFAMDLDHAIVQSSSLTEDQSSWIELTTGRDLELSKPIRYMMDPSNSTIYSVYENFAQLLARNANSVVRDQLSFTQGALNVYFGIPAYFLQVYVASGQNNSSAEMATLTFVQSLPVEQQGFAQDYFAFFFYPMWQTTFFNVSTAQLPPDSRTNVVISMALPAYASNRYDDQQLYYQLGFLQAFTIANFVNESLVRDYVFSAFEQASSAKRSFYEALYDQLPSSPSDEEFRSFARSIVSNHTVYDMPFSLPFDVKKFYVSSDNRIMLMNYDFSKEARYQEDRSEPIMENVVTVRELVRRIGQDYDGFIVYVSGTAPSEYDQREIFSGAAEFMVTIVLVTVLIALFFRSVVSPAFPLGAIAIALILSNVFVYVVGRYFLTVDFTVTRVLQTVLLATGTDYSIFLISRYRDERLDGKDVREAVHVAITWAGESIATSGGAVMISFIALSLGSFPFVRALGITIGAAVTIAILIALSFIPSLILLMGDRVFWPFNRKMGKVRESREKGKKTLAEMYFEGSAKFSMKHAKAIVAASLLISIPATYIVLTDHPSFDFAKGATPTESSEGLRVLKESFGAGLFLRTFVIVQFPESVYSSDGNLSISKLSAIDALEKGLQQRNPIIKSAQGPTNPLEEDVDYRNVSFLPEPQRSELQAAMTSFVGKDNRTVRFFVVLSEDVFSETAIDSIDDISSSAEVLKQGNVELRAAKIYVGGVTAIFNDVRDNTNRDFQIMAAVVMVGLYIVLLLVLGSVLIPLRSILTILLSISWTLAASMLLFHFWKALDLIFILPLMVFVLAMGLGMDYDIFIITRVREEVAYGKSDEEAIFTAMKRTGAIISAAGAVMAGSFLTLMFSPAPVLVQIGFALAFVILLDSMIVRIYLVPAIMVLAGKYNWWAPGPLQRVRKEEKPTAKKGTVVSFSLSIAATAIVLLSVVAAGVSGYKYSVSASKDTYTYGLLASSLLLGLLLVFLSLVSRGRSYSPDSLGPGAVAAGPLTLLAVIAALDAWALPAVETFLNANVMLNTTLIYVTSYGLSVAIVMLAIVAGLLLKPQPEVVVSSKSKKAPSVARKVR